MSISPLGVPQSKSSEDGLRRAFGGVADTNLVGIQVGVAAQEDDYREAFRVVHDSYVELGYIQRQPEELWLQPHHCHGRSTVLIAKRGDQVVGTVSVFHDGDTGLPVERSYPDAAHSFRRNGSVFEIGALAVTMEERGTGLAVLVQTAALYCGGRVHDASHCLITVPPSRVLYYAALFGFSVLRHDRPYYGFEQPAVLMHLAAAHFDRWSAVYPEPPKGWHTVRSLMQSSSYPRANFASGPTTKLAHFEGSLPASSRPL